MAVLFFDMAIWSPVFTVSQRRNRRSPVCQKTNQFRKGVQIKPSGPFFKKGGSAGVPIASDFATMNYGRDRNSGRFKLLGERGDGIGKPSLGGRV